MTFRDLRQELIWLTIKLIRQVTHKTSNKCENCQTLSEILDWTEKELKTRTKELEKAKCQLKRIEGLAQMAAESGAAVMSGEGVPRGEWSFAKGQNDLGNRILGILERNPYHPKKSIGRLFKQLFR